MGLIELVCSEGRIFGARYYTVKPIADWEDPISQRWRDMIEWVVTNYGPTPKDGAFTPGGRWYANNATFYFRNKEDRDWFLLRWQ